MPPRLLLAAALALACLLVAGCKDQREPAKPIVDLSIVVAPD